MASIVDSWEPPVFSRTVGTAPRRHNGNGMPIYEYEPVDRDCLMCEGRIEVIQGVRDKPFVHCPYCGLEVRRVISKASIAISKKKTPDQAAQRGFSTFRRASKGVWEKVAGPDTPAPPEGTASDEDEPPIGEGGVLKV